MSEIKQYTITLPDGRDLDVVEAGIENGPAVIVHNGTPQSAGLFKEHIEDASEKGLRLISYGRPGYGASTRQSERTVASAAKDTAELATALGIERFATWGISGGGPHALACAALLSDRVVAAACLAGIAPYNAEDLEFLAGMGEDNVEEFGAAIEGEGKLKPYLEEQRTAILSSTPEEMAAHMSTLLSDADKAVFTGSFGEQLAQLFHGSLKTGIYGWFDDDLAFTKDWGFSLSDIKVPLQIWQGEQDLMVPYSHGEWLSKHIPQAESHLNQVDGHLTLYLNRIPEVHAWIIKHF
ncbi:alpha/beta fold hydrolase [Pseudalkalibacillus caeni]|uniref:Alpha/beta hydrolase n=1 Tax=Exobacillus caeni TaxID=2574798 RepID=A0A5R9F8M7_9BACL|nr:alpha/beta hydrolase [Pseudalkalibacillus caeni]TLS38600.1 alpha/beta hydrolase [Pseudalkalibacillus caeni]